MYHILRESWSSLTQNEKFRPDTASTNTTPHTCQMGPNGNKYLLKSSLFGFLLCSRSLVRSHTFLLSRSLDRGLLKHKRVLYEKNDLNLDTMLASLLSSISPYPPSPDALINVGPSMCASSHASLI